MADFLTQYDLSRIARNIGPKRPSALPVLLLVALGLIVYLMIGCGNGAHIPGVHPWHDEAQVSLAVPPADAYKRAIAAVAMMHGALMSQDPATHTLGAQLDMVHLVVQIAPEGTGSIATITGGVPSNFIAFERITKVQDYAARLRQGGQ
jgi:hypothetical protein